MPRPFDASALHTEHAGPGSRSPLSAARRRVRVRRGRASVAEVAPGATIAGWAWTLGPPGPEPARAKRMARIGGITAIAALLVYLAWRVTFTMPGPPGHGRFDQIAAWTLVAFEALPLMGLLVRVFTLWDIDSHAPRPVPQTPPGMRVAVLIPTYNEPVEVIAPTIAASCALEPAHETWVLDDGDRPWVEEMCRAYGARYVSRPVHDHAKAGNMNHALDLMAGEAADGRGDVDILAVLDCDHVPLPTFLTATLGWFDDPGIALVQAPQSYYNAGAFDDDGVTGEQGVFFHVLMPARNHEGAGPFWCGSTSLIRTSALREIGGISTDTIVEDMHTTLGLIRAGWKTVYHHQNLAVGLAPDTPEQYLLQRRRWGMGSMQVLAKERLWAAKRWLSWRNYYEYLSGTLWWLEGIATVLVFVVPAVILLSGATTSTAGPLTFGAVFTAMFALRLWGVKRLFRHHLHWPTAFALRIFRVPVGLSCLWWLLTRRSLAFAVTPKGGADERVRGRAPLVLLVLLAAVAAVLAYATAGALGWVPWRATPGATLASGIWLAVAGLALLLGIRRITSAEYATSRRNAPRIAVRAAVTIDGVAGELVDVSVGGVAVRFPTDAAPRAEQVELAFPGADPVRMVVVRTARGPGGSGDVVSMRVPENDWTAYRVMSMWLFHTPPGAVEGLPPGVPAAAASTRTRSSPALSGFSSPEPAVPGG